MSILVWTKNTISRHQRQSTQWDIYHLWLSYNLNQSTIFKQGTMPRDTAALCAYLIIYKGLKWFVSTIDIVKHEVWLIEICSNHKFVVNLWYYYHF